MATERENFLHMLDRSGIGHGTRDDYDKGEAVLVEIEGGLAEFQFNPDGSLREALLCAEE